MGTAVHAANVHNTGTETAVRSVRRESKKHMCTDLESVWLYFVIQIHLPHFQSQTECEWSAKSRDARDAVLNVTRRGAVSSRGAALFRKRQVTR